jgi:SAM-dependent methyltransferase
VTERLVRAVSPRRVLELGAGDYSFDYCQAEGPGRAWVKVDFAEPCDVLCDLNAPEVAIPLDDCSFDLIICTEVLEHVLWPQALLRECHRLLRPGRVLVVSVPNCVSLTYRVAWILGKVPSCAACGNLPIGLGSTPYVQPNGHTVGGHVADYNPQRLRLLVEHGGFRVDSVCGSGVFWHRQLLPHWLVPTALASNVIAVCTKQQDAE